MLKQVTKRTTRVSAENSFEAVAREWYAKFSGEWVPSHGEKIIRRLERGLFPWIGKRPIAEITAPELLAVLRRIESRRALDTAHRAHQNCGQVSAMQLPPDALNAILASYSTWLIWWVSNCLQTATVFASSHAGFITSCFQGWSCLIIEFSIVKSFRMQATSAAFLGLPAATRR